MVEVIDTIESEEETIERVKAQLIIDLRTSTAILSIKDMALVLASVYEDPELEVLVKEINNIRII